MVPSTVDSTTRNPGQYFGAPRSSQLSPYTNTSATAGPAYLARSPSGLTPSAFSQSYQSYQYSQTPYSKPDEDTAVQRTFTRTDPKSGVRSTVEVGHWSKITARDLLEQGFQIHKALVESRGREGESSTTDDAKHRPCGESSRSTRANQRRAHLQLYAFNSLANSSRRIQQKIGPSKSRYSTKAT